MAWGCKGSAEFQSKEIISLLFFTFYFLLKNMNKMIIQRMHYCSFIIVFLGMDSGVSLPSFEVWPWCLPWANYLISQRLSFSSVKFMCVCVCAHAHVLSCPTLCNPMDYSLPGSSVHGIMQARVLEQVATSFSSGSFRPRDWTHISCISCSGRWTLHHWATWKAQV